METPSHDHRDLKYHNGFALGQSADTPAAAYTGDNPSCDKHLPIGFQRLLCGSPDAIARYGSPEAAEVGLVADLVQAGYDIVQIADLLSVYPAAGVFAQRRARQPEVACLWLFEQVAAAQRPSGLWTGCESPADDIQAWAASLPQMTRSQQTDMRLLQAHIELASAAHAFIYTAENATLARLAGISTVSVREVKHRLVARGLLEVMEMGRGRKPVLYRLLAPIQRMASLGPLRRERAANRPVEHLFSECGLGHLAHMVYDTLLRRPYRAASLEKCLKLTSAGVSYGLGPLVALGNHASGQLAALAYEQKGLWYARPADLTEVAKILFAGRWPVRV